MSTRIWFWFITFCLLSCAKNKSEESTTDQTIFKPIDLRKSLVTWTAKYDTGYVDRSFSLDSGLFEFDTESLLGLKLYTTVGLNTLDDLPLIIEIKDIVPVSGVQDTLSQFTLENPTHQSLARITLGEKEVSEVLPIAITYGLDEIVLEGKMAPNSSQLSTSPEPDLLFMGFKVLGSSLETDKMADQ